MGLQNRVLTRSEVESRIAEGDTLVIAQGYVLRLNNWQDVHPGGRLVIQHMVGRDATDELSMYVALVKHEVGTASPCKKLSEKLRRYWQIPLYVRFM